MVTCEIRPHEYDAVITKGFSLPVWLGVYDSRNQCQNGILYSMYTLLWKLK